MDIRSLQYFIAVVESGTISGAAKKLNISQPPLSQQIKSLESELGVILLLRGPRNVTLTDAGKTLYSRALSIIDYFNAAFMEISNHSRGLQGSLLIGTASSCGPILLDIVGQKFTQEYPGITFQIFEKNTFELMNLLDSNIIEVALARTPLPNNSSFNHIVLANETIEAVGSDTFMDASSDTISVDQLASNPLILYRRWEPIVSKYLNENNIIPQYYCINDDARTSLSWARAGMGIALIPTSVTQYVQDKNLIHKKIDDQFFQTKICLVWKASRHLSPITYKFIEFVEHHYTESN